jgi:oxygen-dependent protoporphyrinogen oxidase
VVIRQWLRTLRFHPQITIRERSAKVGGVTDPLPADRRPLVAVIGAGIAGLAAAHELASDGRVDVIVLEGSPRTGGKLLRGEVAGVRTDLGAESLLARRPEAIDLLAELGLAPEAVHPQTLSAAVWSRGGLRPLPVGHVMGVPTNLRALASSGVVSAGAVARAALDEVLPATRVDADTSVAAFVGARLGRAVVDRLVEPLLGGVYAGRADELSLRATLPQVAAVVGSRSLLRALRSRAVAPANAGPVFAGLPGGVGRLTETLTESVISRGVVVRLDSTVRELARTSSGWRLVVGSAAAPETIEPDAVLIATPAAPAGRLLASVAPTVAGELGAIEYASMAIVTMAFSRSASEKPLNGSGFLVPAVAGKLIKAATFSSMKWGWYPEDLVVLRCSIGRRGDVAELQRGDDELIAGAVRDLAEATGVRGTPVDALVTRWGGGLPQYAVGHLDRVARIKSGVESVPRLAVCGAAYDGVGIPACIGSGRGAATQLLSEMFAERQ